MLKKWFIALFWTPFEIFCHWNPIIPVDLEVKTVCEGVQILYINNFVTKILSKISGGYDYAVLYIIDGELVFDTGYAWGARSISRYLKEAALCDSIHSIVNSHYHEDHCGNNKRISSICQGATAFAHPKDAPQIMYPSAFPWYRRFLFGPVQPHTVVDSPKRFHLNSGRELKVIETPGHTPGHICLYDPKEKILFAGDLFIDISVDSQLSEVNGSDWIESLQAVGKLDIQFLLDGHGVVLTGLDVQLKLNQKQKFLETMKRNVFEIVAKGPPKSLNALVKSVFSSPSLVNLVSMNEGWMSVLTSGDFSRSHLVRGFVDDAIQEISRNHIKESAPHRPQINKP